MFHIATPEEIKAGKVTDVYFVRTRQILEAEGIHKWVKAEFAVKRFPDGYAWGVLAGLEEAVGLLEGLDVNVRAMEEGAFFGPNQPVLVIEGSYLTFGVYETALLGLLCQASGIATKAARCRKAAGERLVISFGARRMHPALAPMIERNAYIGGCDGVAAVQSAERLGIEPSGTIPHALILLMGDSTAAVEAFHRVIDPAVKRVALVDTFQDEKFESLRAARALGEDLFAVRLDTPSSRRGDLLSILQEVRWELDLRGYEHVKLFVSGGLDEYTIWTLNPAADAYGVGTSISNAPVLDFSMDIVEIEGEPIAKRGKASGGKDVFRCPSCHATRVVPESCVAPSVKPICTCGVQYIGLLQLLVERGRVVREMKPPQAIRRFVVDQLAGYTL